MRNVMTAALLGLATIVAAPTAQAQEADFLSSLDGSFTGTGTVKVRTNSKPVKVTCTFSSNASGNALSLNGRCRGLVVVSRAISADLRAKGSRYSGTYVGAGTGPASLSGSRRGNAISLGVRWSKEVNGDRQAQLKVEKVGADRLRLTTTDKDPETGQSVVTSRIDLRRS